jgi:hypothetical protein
MPTSDLVGQPGRATQDQRSVWYCDRANIEEMPIEHVSRSCHAIGVRPARHHALMYGAGLFGLSQMVKHATL